MATNLQTHIASKALPSLQYWNRTISRGDALKDIGGVPCQSPADLANKCDVIFISVSDDEALKSLINTLSTSSMANKIIVDTTTVHPSTTAFVAKHVTSLSAAYIAAPVFGATPVARAAQLVIALAGPPDAMATITPFVQGVLGRAVVPVGEQPAQALLLKTTSNFITAGLMLLLSEAHTLASMAGLPADTLHALVGQHFGAYAHGVSERLVAGAYCPAVGEAPRSGLELGIKDVGHGVDLARDKGMRLTLGDMYLEAAGEAKKWGDERGRKMDSSFVYGVVRTRAGEEFETDLVKQRDSTTDKKGAL
ncbi:hypothetical protein ACEQ8H_001800 [Pleosporales sp. CAS-2024a]